MLSKIRDKFQKNELIASMAIIVFSMLISYILLFNLMARLSFDITDPFILNVLTGAILLLPGIISGVTYYLIASKRKKAFLMFIVTDVLWFIWFAKYAAAYLENNL
ncbi:MAG: hypothetical protein WC788_05865 [Candidatus Paceibacterota bacterium]